MKKFKHLKWISIGFVVFIAIAAAIVSASLRSGGSPLAFKVRRYQTNANEIVAYVHIQNISENIVQFENQRGTMRLRCEYAFKHFKRTDPSVGSSFFLHPREAFIGEIVLPSPHPASVGVMIRKMPPQRRFPGRGLKLFLMSLEVRIRSMFDYKPCYLPEPLDPSNLPASDPP